MSFMFTELSSKSEETSKGVDFQEVVPLDCGFFELRLPFLDFFAFLWEPVEPVI